MRPADARLPTFDRGRKTYIGSYVCARCIKGATRALRQRVLAKEAVMFLYPLRATKNNHD
jgi:hypothetical protein